MKNHRQHRRRFSNRTIWAMAAGVVIAYVVILLGVRAVGNRLEQNGASETVGSLEGRFDTQQVTLEAKGRTWTYRKNDLTNILFIGTDWNQEEEISTRYAGQADFLLLVSLDKANKVVSSVQIDRDTLADVRIYGVFGDYAGIRHTQICLSYAFGDTAQSACENTAWSVSRLLGGIPIDGCIAMGMEGIVPLNDALGGVTVTLEDDFSHLDPQMVQGDTITLHGQQAEYFVRGRMNVGEGTNQARMRRQSAFMAAAIEKIVEEMEKDMDYVSELLESISDYLTMNRDKGWLINRAYESRTYARTQMRQIVGSHDIGADGFVEFTANKDALNDLLTDIFFE